MSVVRAIGLATPPHSISQAQSSELAKAIAAAQGKDARFIDAIHRRSGIDRRASVIADATVSDESAPAQTFYCAGQPGGPTTAERMARYRVEAGELGARAARLAIEQSDVAPGAVTHLITVSCTGFASPGLDTETVDALGLSRDVRRAHVGFMGCHGAINALRVADALVERDGSSESAALVVCVELCTLHMRDDVQPDRVVANALFADGAAAMVLAPESSSGSGWRLISTASHLVEHTHDAMEWVIGNNGFEMTLAESVPGIIRERLGSWCRDWLGRNGIEGDDLNHLGWAIHPGGPRILDAARDAMAIPESCVEHARATLRAHGNMSSPTVIFILDRISRQTSASRAVLLAFGPGLTIEAALLERV